MSDPTTDGAARKGFGQVQERFGALLGDDKTRLNGYANQAHGTVSQWVGKAADALDGYLDRAPAQMQDPGRRATRFARDRPVATAVGLAAVALLLTRGGRRR